MQINNESKEQIANLDPKNMTNTTSEIIEKPQRTLQDQMMVNAMTVESEVFNPIVYTQMKKLAQDLIIAKSLPMGITTAEQALVIMQYGRELGIPPITSLQSVYVVNGRLTLWGSMVISRLTLNGYRIQYTEETNDSCTVTVSKDGMSFTETYTYGMADKSGYTKDRSGLIKIGWREGANRKLKLRYGAISLILKSYLPHLLNGGEIKEVWEDVEVAEQLPVPKKQEMTTEEAPKVSDLLKK